MEFGSKVILERGFGYCRRSIQGTLVGAQENKVLVRLEEDDLSGSWGGYNDWHKKGQVGCCLRSALRTKKVLGYPFDLIEGRVILRNDFSIEDLHKEFARQDLANRYIRRSR